jgi:hypothetical protein
MGTRYYRELSIAAAVQTSCLGTDWVTETGARLREITNEALVHDVRLEVGTLGSPIQTVIVLNSLTLFLPLVRLRCGVVR